MSGSRRSEKKVGKEWNGEEQEVEHGYFILSKLVHLRACGAKMHALTPSTGCTGYTAKGREKMCYLRFYVIDNAYQFLSQHSMHHGDDNGASV